MAVGLLLSSLLLSNHQSPTHSFVSQTQVHVFGIRPFNSREKEHFRSSLASCVAEQTDVDIYNSTNECGRFSTDVLLGDEIELEPNELVTTESSDNPSRGSERMISSSEINGGLQDSGGYQEQDDRHDEFVDNIIRHFRGEIVTYDNQDDGTGQGGGESKNKDKDLPSSDRRRANVQLPPGWGKTQLALKLIASLYTNGIGQTELPLKRAIYVTPRLVLVDQVLDHINRFGELRNVPHSRLIVASKSNTTEALTTCPDEIAEFLQPDDRFSGLRLLICTYNSLPRVGKALSILNRGGNVTSLDLAIFDEAHEMEGVGKVSGYGLYDSLLPTKYRLFLTATPRQYTESPEEKRVLGSKLRRDGSNILVARRTNRKRTDVRSFDDSSLFGPCIARRTLRESMEQNITVPLTLVAIDKAEMSSLLESSFDPMTSRDELLPFMLRAAFHKLNVRRAVSFHSLNKRARAFVEGAKRVFDKDITTVAVDGTMSASKREAVLSEAKRASASVVANCRLLATGVDEAEWDLVFMADPVTSPVLCRQMIGRVTRVAPDKTRGYVLVPVFVDAYYDLEDLNSTMADKSMGYQWFTAAFQAMVADDPILCQDVVYVAEESKRIGRPLLSSEYPKLLRDAFMLPPTMPIEMKNNLMERVVVEVSASNAWDQSFELFLKYKKREGHCDIPKYHKEDGINLGRWLQTQRACKKKGTLDLSREQHLEEAGVKWNVFDENWNDMYRLLLQYRDREGHCDVPRKHKEDSSKFGQKSSTSNLGSWLQNQRTAKKKGTLDISREQRLEEAGVKLNVSNEKNWDDMYRLLLQYRDREGHCDVPKRHKEDSSKFGQKSSASNLGSWLRWQRTEKKKGTLDFSRVQRLEEAGVKWDISDEYWKDMYRLLLQYREREGNCDVPRRHIEDGFNLGMWLSNQRQYQRRGTLPSFKKQQLEGAGISWDPKLDKWNKMYALLLQFREHEGHCNVPCGYKENGMSLGSWLDKQRTRKRKGKLDQKRLKLLDEAGVTWYLRKR